MKAFKAARPVQTAMSTDKLTSIIGTPPRPWQEALKAYVESLSQR
jgi:dTDP-4-dehydrorhamnose reductase